MSADTAAKRLSAMQPLAPWRGNAVVPSGTVDAAERRTVLGLYSQFDGAAADAVPAAWMQYRQRRTA